MNPPRKSTHSVRRGDRMLHPSKGANGKQETENRKCKTGQIDQFSVSGFPFPVFHFPFRRPISKKSTLSVRRGAGLNVPPYQGGTTGGSTWRDCRSATPALPWECAAAYSAFV